MIDLHAIVARVRALAHGAVSLRALWEDKASSSEIEAATRRHERQAEELIKAIDQHEGQP